MILRRREELRVLVHMTLAAALYIAALAHSLWWAPLAIFVGMHILAIEHNHAHVSMFRMRWMTRLADDALTLLCGIPQVFWHVHHLRSHHPHTWQPEDWSSPFNYHGSESPNRPVGYRYYQLTYYPLFAASSIQNILLTRHPVLMRSLARNLFVLLAGSITLIWLFGFTRWLIVMIPAYAGAALMLGSANYIEHWNSHQDNGEFEAWTFTCGIYNRLNYNAGYHWLHHLRPTLHWSELAATHRDDSSYCRPELIETGLFPGYRTGSSFRRWLAGDRPPRASPAETELAASARRSG